MREVDLGRGLDLSKLPQQQRGQSRMVTHFYGEYDLQFWPCGALGARLPDVAFLDGASPPAIVLMEKERGELTGVRHVIPIPPEILSAILAFLQSDDATFLPDEGGAAENGSSA